MDRQPETADIVLVALNARYAHCALGLRCLLANLGALESRAKLLEFSPDLRAPEIAEAILSLKPAIVGLGVYIWNADESRRLVGELKRLRPELVVVLGGPEVSHETAAQRVCEEADFVICGEGDLEFARLCGRLLAGERPAGKIIAPEKPDLNLLELPYRLYTDEDIAGRVIYLEASRGCPFKCDFCLSALDAGVRAFPKDKLFREWEKLLDRGARRFKFVDRTFNLDPAAAAAVLEFFLERARPGLFLHFEVIADNFPEELFALIKRFPPGALQLEIGVQTFSEEVARRIGRRQDNAAAEKNIRRLRGETEAHLHADLIAGLPGEDLAGFAAGFDRLAALRPHEIQVGILKRLRGAPIARHDKEWGMVYSQDPPYELRQNYALDFFTVQRLRRFARYWDLVANSGLFPETVKAVCGGPGPFGAFLALSDWLYTRTGQAHGISRSRLRDLLRAYLVDELKYPEAAAAGFIERDALNSRRSPEGPGLERQARHRRD